jgi:hypothetical protein
MNTKRKDGKEPEPPVWLVNLLIRERVWRWRVSERLRRWVARELPRRLRFYFIVFLLVGGLGCMLVLLDALHGRYDLPAAKYQGIDLHLIEPWDKDARPIAPRLRHDAEVFWRLADSIESNSRLRRELDSLMRSRPGLADSLQRVKDEVPRVPDGLWGLGGPDTSRGSRSSGVPGISK